jgi:hypothetical protein
LTCGFVASNFCYSPRVPHPCQIRSRALRSPPTRRAAPGGSGSDSVSTVSAPLAGACRRGMPERIVSPRRPRTWIGYRCVGGSLRPPVTAHHLRGDPPAGGCTLARTCMADPS